MQIEQLYRLYLQQPFVQTDTRQLKPGDVFFALKGARFNANEFAREALAKGAAYAVLDEDPGIFDERFIRVENVLQSLQQLAKYHRLQFPIPFLAITGSNGKTTTKELIHAVLSSTFRTYTTEGNLNNHIGIPLTILRIKKDAELAVIEMGANHQKEIASYCTYTLPTHGLITNCGKAHLEGFGGIEGVKKGKGELYDYLRENNGSIFINSDYDYLNKMSAGIKNKITYGTRNAETTGKLVPSETFLKIEITNDDSTGIISTNLVGDYNLPNVLAAVSTGRYFKIPGNRIKAAIETYFPSNSRSQLIEKDTNKIIMDAYNANPTSMKAAIENFSRLQAGKKVLMLGAMAELGDESLSEHQQIIDLIKQYEWHEVVLVGGDFQKLSHPFMQFNSAPDAGKWLRGQQFRNTSILIKGSRSMQMEKLLEA